MAYLVGMTFSDRPTDRPAPPALDCKAHAVFLDFDGTLVDIAPRPDAITVPPDLAERLEHLRSCANGALAIVSGRSLHELERFLAGFEGILIGSHGAEARGIVPPVPDVEHLLPALQAELAAFAARHDLLYEHKTLGGAVHYRQAPEAGDAVAHFAAHLVSRNPGFEVQPAKMAVELRPEGVSKDGALALVSAEPAFAERMPVYLGDDTTDEPALAWAQDRGGFGVKVGAGASAARYRLPHPGAVRAWLDAAMEA